MILQTVRSKHILTFFPKNKFDIDLTAFVKVVEKNLISSAMYILQPCTFLPRISNNLRLNYWKAFFFNESSSDLIAICDGKQINRKYARWSQPFKIDIECMRPK